jgi:acyl-CoA-binding protein
MATQAQSPAFKQAAEDSRKLKAKPAVDELLQVSPPFFP